MCTAKFRLKLKEDVVYDDIFSSINIFTQYVHIAYKVKHNGGIIWKDKVNATRSPIISTHY